jgi:hypothetical protein
LHTHAVASQSAAADHWLAAREQFDSIITHRRSPQAQQMTHSELEIGSLGIVAKCPHI